MDRLHLLRQVVFLLSFLDLSTDLGVYLFFEIQDVDLGAEKPRQFFQALFGIRRLEEFLPIGYLGDRVGADGVRQARGILQLGQGLAEFGKGAAAEFDILIKEIRHVPHQRQNLGLPRNRFRDLGGPRAPESLRGQKFRLHDADAGKALEKNLERPIRHLQMLYHLGQDADGIKVRNGGIFHLGLPLRHD